MSDAKTKMPDGELPPSIFKGKNVLVYESSLIDPWAGKVLDLVDDFGIFYYKIKIESGSIFFVNVNDISKFELIKKQDNAENLVQLKK